MRRAGSPMGRGPARISNGLSNESSDRNVALRTRLVISNAPPSAGRRDACEETAVAPEIEVVDNNGISVRDNGPGMPAETIAGVLDFAVRVSNREAYVAPDRGAQGNALKDDDDG